MSIAVDVEALRVRLRAMNDAELLKFGLQMHDLVYPLRYAYDGKPVVSAFSIQLGEARSEWRRRKRGERFFLAAFASWACGPS